MNVDWDPAKNLANRRKHGISFEVARAVFDDPNRVDDYDDRDYGEERWIVIGRIGPLVIYVVYTNREGEIRLISARKAARHEEVRYFRRSARG
jgi:uncharacterized protein